MTHAGLSASVATAADTARRRMLFILPVGCFMGMTSWFAAAAVLPQLAARWSLPMADGGVVTMMAQLGFVAATLCSAALNLSDRYEPRRLIFLGATIAAASNAATALAPNLALGLATRVAVGAGLALVYPPFVKLVAGWFRVGRALALGLVLGGLTLGTALPHLARAFAALGAEASANSVLLSTAFVTFLGGVGTLAFAGSPHDLPPPSPFAPRMAWRALAPRGVRLALFGYLGHMWELYAMWAWLPLFLTEKIHAAGASTFTGAICAFFVVASGVVGCVVGGIVAERRGRIFVASASLAASGIAALVVGWDATPLGAQLLLAWFWGLTINADSGQFTALVSEAADQAYVGTAVTMQLALGFLLTNVTIWAVPRLRDAFGWGPAFAMLAIGPLFGFLAMRRLTRVPVKSAR